MGNIMTLENIVSIGKKEKKTFQAVEAFRQDNTLNLSVELAQIEGTAEHFRRLGLDPARFASLTTTEHSQIGNTLYEHFRNDLIQAVQDCYHTAVKELGKGDEGRQSIAGVLTSVKPVEYSGAPKDIYKAHKDAHRAFRATADPASGFREILGELKDNKGRASAFSMALQFLSTKHKELQAEIVMGRFSEAQVKLYEALKNSTTAINYVNSVYNNVSDEGKKNIAYAIGKSLTERNERESRR
jgi:hypothetical protein